MEGNPVSLLRHRTKLRIVACFPTPCPGGGVPDLSPLRGNPSSHNSLTSSMETSEEAPPYEENLSGHEEAVENCVVWKTLKSLRLPRTAETSDGSLPLRSGGRLAH